MAEPTPGQVIAREQLEKLVESQREYRSRNTCDWCSEPVECYTCPQGTYHMHRHCHPIAVSQGYFSKLSAAQQQIPVECGVGLVHMVLGYRQVN